MKITTHLFLAIASEFAAFGLGALGFMVFSFDKLSDMGIQLILNFGLAIFIPVMLVRGFFRLVLPAQCDQEGCTGRSFPRGMRPIKYVCKSCGHVLETGVSEGRGSSAHDMRDD